MKLTLDANAKINLFLDIICRLENGYHSLFMLMQSVSLCDKIAVEIIKSGISLTCSEKALPTDEKNLAYKAARLFFDETGIDGGAKIHIDKHIPFAAGLAGGSADAAAVLTALNRLYETGFGVSQLCSMGVKLGADIPFCLIGGTALAQDIGQIISPLPKIKDCFIVIAKPKRGVSTKAAFSAFDSCTNIIHPDRVGILNAAANADFEGVCSRVGNVFEQFVEVPERVEIKRVMRASGSAACCMSGSGPSVFGIFENKSAAEKCASQLKAIVPSVFVCTPMENFS